jgi:hypothetical protein
MQLKQLKKSGPKRKCPSRVSTGLACDLETAVVFVAVEKQKKHRLHRIVYPLGNLR